MNDAPTVDEALRKGQKMVNYPAIAIMFGVIVVGLYVAFQKTFSVWIFLTSIVIAIVAAWLYWSIMITKWRVWAFENVRNVHELKDRAVKEKLIWKDGSFFERTEIRNAADKAKLAAIQPKFELQDIFNDDFGVPAETSIYYSRANTFVEMALASVAIGYGVYLIFQHGNTWFIICALVAGAAIGYSAIRKTSSHTAQIVLNEQGIETEKAGFSSWEDISHEDVIREGYGEYTKYYLTYTYPGGDVKLETNDFGTSQRELDKLLRIYRGRYNKKTGRPIASGQ